MMLAVALGLMLVPSSGNADEKVPYPLSGNGLLAACEKYEPDKRMGTEAAVCAGYVQGVTDAIALYDDLLELDTGAIEALTGRRSCIPAGTTYAAYSRDREVPARSSRAAPYAALCLGPQRHAGGVSVP